MNDDNNPVKDLWIAVFVIAIIGLSYVFFVGG